MATRPAVSGKKATPTAGAAKKKSAKPAATPASTPSRAAPQKKATTITLKTVFEAIAEGHDIPKKQANALLAAMVETVTKHLI
jgi:DNA-binding protein HU-beta